MNIVVYIINLDGSEQRLQSLSTHLNQSKIEFIRVSAFDGRSLDVNEFISYNQKKSMQYMGRALNGGEIGCFMSHLKCAEYFLNSQADYAIVLEDDALPKEGWYHIVERLLNWLEDEYKSWYLINIGANKHKIYTHLLNLDQYQLHQAHYFPMLTTALIWSRDGAQQFMTHKENIYCPVDNFFRDWLTDNDKGLSVWPALVSTTGAESDIDDKSDKRSKLNRHYLYGYIKQKRLWKDKLKAIKHKYFRDKND